MKRIKPKPSNAKRRSCFPCKACCVHMAVEEIDKAEGDPCPNMAACGCGIYAKRPATCRGFKCAWLAGMLSDDARPDVSGLLMWTGLSIMGPTLFIREIYMGALEEHAEAVEALRAAGPTIVMQYDGGRLAACPEGHPAEELLKELAAKLEAKAEAN